MDVIRFLETLGSKPLMATEYAAAIGTLGVDAELRRALLERDHSALSNMLGGRGAMCCLVVAAETIQ
jgi:hypothetical protein